MYSLQNHNTRGLFTRRASLTSSNRRTSLLVHAVSAPRKPANPVMRDLSPSDSSKSLIRPPSERRATPPPPVRKVSPPPPPPSTTSTSQQPQLMVYRGPPASNGVNNNSSSTNGASPHLQNRFINTNNGVYTNGTTTTTTTTTSSSRTAPSSTTTNTARRTSSSSASGGLFAGMDASSTGGTTFQRSMMVAGFEDDDTSSSSSSALPMDYKYSWAQEDYSELQRTIDTWSFVLTLRARIWLLDQKWSYGQGGMTDEKRSLRAKSLAIFIRERLLQLGPTFIKLGQLFSTRSDLFPAEFTVELSKLQDRVPAFDTAKAAAIIERELGAPPSQLFAEFDPVPIAAASLGQVHRATLFSGEQVVVKVQRPGLRRLFDIDLENLRKIAEQLDKGEDTTRDFKGIYQECATILYQEIDYINEGRNADRFRRNFKGTDWVRVPKVYWQHTSTAVLTMQYLPGIKVTNATAITNIGINAPSIATRCTESYLTQILKHGFFHADPHPGNIAVDTKGRLIFYDFGMMGEIVPNIRERLLDLFYAIAKKDVDTVLTNLVNLGIIVPSADTLSVRRALAYFVDNIGRQAEQQETVSAIGEDLFAIAIDSPFRFPATFTFVLRAFATLEGIGKSLDPDFAFAKVAAPYAQELLDLQDGRQTAGVLLGQLQRQATDLGAATAAVPTRVAKIERTIGQMESGDLKLRVRVLESERAARRQGVLQIATLNTVASMGFMNVGVQLALAEKGGVAGAAMVLSAVFAGLVVFGIRRVKRLDKFEDGIKGKGKFPVN